LQGWVLSAWTDGDVASQALIRKQRATCPLISFLGGGPYFSAASIIKCWSLLEECEVNMGMKGSGT
jgi:hypothetical protein